VWSLLGAKLRLRNAAGFSCAPSATLLALVILLDQGWIVDSADGFWSLTPDRLAIRPLV
jgi:hypothetical protein